MSSSRRRANVHNTLNKDPSATGSHKMVIPLEHNKHHLHQYCRHNHHRPDCTSQHLIVAGMSCEQRSGNYCTSGAGVIPVCRDSCPNHQSALRNWGFLEEGWKVLGHRAACYNDYHHPHSYSRHRVDRSLGFPRNNRIVPLENYVGMKNSG